MLAATYAQLNRKMDALKAGERASELAPGNVMMQVFLASLQADVGRNDLARQRLAEVLNSPNPREAFVRIKNWPGCSTGWANLSRCFALRAAGDPSTRLPEYSGQDLREYPRCCRRTMPGTMGRCWGVGPVSIFPRHAGAPVFL